MGRLSADNTKRPGLRNVDDYIRDNWPKGLPEDCTQLNKHDDDCLEMNLPKRSICSPCRMFEMLDLDAIRRGYANRG